MARTWTIVGIGEALRAEYPDRIEPAGVPLLVALQAARFGHRGIPISRIGQDVPGDELAGMLSERGVELDHLQRDPDHPTGRLKVQAIGRLVRRSLDPHAAFDELQWDFDLSDVAPVADAIICGQLGSRSSQARSVIERFLDEAPTALRIADLTERSGLDTLRSEARTILERVDIALADEDAVRVLIPRGRDTELASLCKELCRAHRLVCITLLKREDTQVQMTIIGDDGSVSSAHLVQVSGDLEPHVAPICAVSVAHGMLAGWSNEACLALAMGALRFSSEPGNGDAPLTPEMLNAPSANGA